MSVEKNKKEIKESLLNARALSDEELKQVAGGVGGVYRAAPGEPDKFAMECPHCGYSWGYVNRADYSEEWKCPQCEITDVPNYYKV